MTVPLRKRVKRRVRSALVRAVARLFGLVPLRPALALAALVGRVGWRAAARTRALMLAQLAIAFPDRTPEERAAIGRASLVHLARLAAEVATLRAWRDRLPEYVRFTPGAEERFAEAVGRGKGLVFATGHVGNWELLAQRIALRWPSAVIARSGNDPAVTELVGRIRAEGNLETLWREEPSTARAMIRTFRQGRPLGILIDQDTRVQSVFVPFFGRPAATPRGAAELALRFGAPVLAGWCRRAGPRPGDGHVIDFAEVPYDPDPPDREEEIVRLTAACSALLEAAIRASPAEWVWMHERWRTRPELVAERPQANRVPKSVELSSG
ncbi:MAG TPA: lysophospholipid acyltransferase family protein [Anaeromyxobacter sp.]